jgi:hypothetical protein
MQQQQQPQYQVAASQQQFPGGYNIPHGQGPDVGSSTRNRAMKVREDQMSMARQKEEQTLKKSAMPPPYYDINE